MTVAMSTNWPCTACPALVIKSDFYPGRRSTKRSMRGCNCDFVSFLSDRGKPKYLRGKSSIRQGRWPCTVLMSSAEHCIGAMLLFWMCVLSPEATPNKCKICTVRSMSDAAGRRKITMSSAYSDKRCWMERYESGWRSPSTDAFVTIKLRTSMTKMNNIGDKGSPCRRPRWWVMGSPGIPFKST
jgi:hypothetical protein